MYLPSIAYDALPNLQNNRLLMTSLKQHSIMIHLVEMNVCCKPNAEFDLSTHRFRDKERVRSRRDLGSR